MTFRYDVVLSHEISPQMFHALNFSQEPRDTFGSNAETETTSYGYIFTYRDLLVRGLDFNFSATYEEDTPLGEPDAVTEETTTLETGLIHTRMLTRRLERVLSYRYSWEDTNFQDDAPKQKHLVVYGLSYLF